MLHHWLIITFSWFGSVSLQYINTGVPGSYDGLDFMEGPQYPLGITNYHAPQIKNDFPNLEMDPLTERFYERDDVIPANLRKRRELDESEKVGTLENRWNQDLLQNEDEAIQYLAGYSDSINENSTANDILETVLEKKYFSPWGGKRNKPGPEHSMEHMWTWKRSNGLREPSMPKRVRFSPWGGKRSGKMVYKPGSKSSKIIFSSSIPELTRIVSNYLPNGKRIDIGGFAFVPIMDKLHPVKILAMASKTSGRPIRDAMPFKNYFDTTPTGFRIGHPYSEVNMKKDGKRKVKFSAWGGKRSPPIIGPIWTPTPPHLREEAVKAILLLQKSNQEKNDQNAS